MQQGGVLGYITLPFADDRLRHAFIYAVTGDQLFLQRPVYRL